MHKLTCEMILTECLSKCVRIHGMSIARVHWLLHLFFNLKAVWTSVLFGVLVQYYSRVYTVIFLNMLKQHWKSSHCSGGEMPFNFFVMPSGFQTKS